MTAAEAYAPPRSLAAKVQRRLTQWRAAHLAHLVFDRPILSVCFDDFPRSAATHGAPILERYSGRGTFYASADLALKDGPCGPGFSADDLARLHRAGHEIGCHTFSHSDCARMRAYDVLVDIARNRDALAQMGHAAPLRTLAYPYGETSPALKAALPPRLGSARGIQPGLNAGRTDLAQLRAYALFGDGLARAHRALERGARANAWVIAFTHDVADAPSPWGTHMEDFRAFIVRARDAGFMLAPVSAALERTIHAAH
ncbi:MAG TPA: polysaccharide deacetylase family protein [Caulobacterales bacterium]|nr:polysaccharide deacetylase family protein [Caulobacterales bacterium]